MSQHPSSHRRQNLLTGEWILVSPQRTRRPWQGQIEAQAEIETAAYDSNCYLCPGNARAGNHSNPAYTGPYAFDNDFPALTAGQDVNGPTHPILRAEPESGRCRVFCFSERHDLHWAGMSLDQVVDVLSALAGECRSLDAQPDINYVQAFENRGEMMGCSNPHPHAQIWATASIPEEPGKELAQQQRYWQKNNRALLLDYLSVEEQEEARILFSNDHAVSLVPFWATWPFETLLLPREPCGALHFLDEDALAGFAEILQQTIRACDNLFGVPMPYSMGFHPRPSDGAAHPEWQFHVHIYPPLLRSATVRKHMVGFEMLGMPQRDITAEAAAERLRQAARE